jgi:hypothetical protein
MSAASGYLQRQFDMACQLAEYHLDTLTTEECLWRPAERGLHIHAQPDGSWRADWPEHEGYDLGPSSIGWLTWHLLFWWSMALDHNFGPGTLQAQDVQWPGDADGVRAKFADLKARWHAALSEDRDLAAAGSVRWPFSDRPLGDLFAWANTELVKSAAEIGYARFLYAATASRQG